MKTSIHIRRGGEALVEISVNKALGKIPLLWRGLLPDFSFSSVPLNHLPRQMQKTWGIGVANPYGYARNWSVRLMRKRNGYPRNIMIFLLEPNEPEGEILFQRDILSAMFTTTLENTVVLGIAKSIARKLSLSHRFQMRTLLTRELPSFLMNRDVADKTQSDLAIFFDQLEGELQNFAQPQSSTSDL